MALQTKGTVPPSQGESPFPPPHAGVCTAPRLGLPRGSMVLRSQLAPVGRCLKVARLSVWKQVFRAFRSLLT